jgi:polyisoprenoid-binding protein YceI
MLPNFRSQLIRLTMLAALVAACAPAATPAPVSSVSPAPAATDTVAAPAPTAESAAAVTDTPGSSAVPTVSTNSTSGGSGTNYILVPSKNEASYTIREQLARLSFPSDAIGKTNVVTGSITVKADGTIDTAASKFTVDVSTLKSDQGMRDGYVSRAILQTNQYPDVVFVPTQVSGLPATLPQSGDVSFKLVGNLTIRDVTKPVTWDVTGTVNSGDATGLATTTFTFEDFNLPQPRVSVVLSVVDKITLNVSVDLQPAGGQ